MANEYDAMLAGEQANEYDSLIGTETAQRRGNLDAGLNGNPDAYAKAMQLSRATGAPAGAVSRQLPEVERRVRLNEYDNMLAQSPALASAYATDGDFARVAADDTPTLASIESGIVKAAKFAGRGLGSIASGLPTAGAGMYGAAAAPFELLGLDTVGGFLREQQRSAQGVAKAWQGMSPDAGLVERGVMSGLQSAGQNLAMLPLGFMNAGRLAGEQLMLGTMGVITGGTSYGKARDAGLSPARAIPYAVEDATAEIVTEKYLGAAGLLRNIKAGASTGKLFMYELAKEVPGEMAATLWQNFNEWTNINQDKSVGDFLAEQPAAMAETVIATLVGGTTQIGAVKAFERAIGVTAQRQAQAQAAEEAAGNIEGLTQAADQSKLKARDPQTFRAFVEQASENGQAPAEMFIDAQTLANTLNQSAVSMEELKAMAPSIAAQLSPENLVPGADVRIPVSELLAAPSEITGPLIDHLRAAPEEMSRAESQAFMSAQGEQIQQQVEQELGRADERAAYQQGVDQVASQFQSELDMVGRFRPEVNKAYASLLGNFYAAQAQRAGMTPQELMSKYRLSFASTEGKGARQLDQGGQARGALNFGDDITQTPSVIALLKSADLTTAVHESGHFFLEVQADLAARIAGKDFDGDTVTQGERQIVADMDTVLRELGIIGTPDQSALTTWLSMSIEEKREHHETFARGFERYAMEGRAPNQALQDIFQRFRSWLVQVYKTLKGLNVEISDDMRQVLDRMLATDQAIQEAQDARNMGPLFQTPDQGGMTPEEYAEYQALGQEATAAATAELDDRLLKDMKWMTGAKNRALKARQKEVAALRSETMIEVRGEVMAQPVYRAWQFLTGKVSPEVAATMKKTGARTLNPAADNLFTAISKLGGLNKVTVESQWGKQDKLEGGVFGMPLLRQEGLSIDAMAERLVEVGYLLPDEGGKADLTVFEELFADQARGVDRFSIQHEYAGEQPTETLTDPDALRGKLNTDDLKGRYGEAPDAIWRKLSARRMTNSQGVDADVLAESFRFSSGDELVRALAEAEPPRAMIDALTDQRMLERHGDIASKAALERAAEEAIHNEVRARVIATELRALTQAETVRAPGASGRSTVNAMAQAAKSFAAQVIARQKIKDLRPRQYAAAEARSAKLAMQSLGNTQEAAMHKRNQLVNNYAARAAMDAQAEVTRAAKYLERVQHADLPAEYREQIDAILDRFDIKRSTTLKTIDKRKSLLDWVESQREIGIEPVLPEGMLDEARRVSVKDLTVEEFRGMVDTVKMIEHLGRLKDKLLTAKDQRVFSVVKQELIDSIALHGKGRTADTRTPTTTPGVWFDKVKGFGANHIKVATWARIMDGGKDGGPMWERFIRGANEAGDRETTMRAEATKRLSEIMAPVLKGRNLRKKAFYPSLKGSYTRESVLAMALNTGNASNLQRLLGGEGWTTQQLQPVLDTLTAEEWKAVQAVWDQFESYRPLIGAKERRVSGKEPDWIDPTPVVTKTAGTLRGGYYPVKYDASASVRAEEHADAEEARQQMKGAYGAATTQRSFTKTRAEEVVGRPLLYTLQGMYGGINDVIHDLAWHEWLIDTNRLLKSRSLDAAIRSTYGPQVVRQFKSWRDAVAVGDSKSQDAIDGALNRLRQGVSISGLGFNLMSAMMQPLGLTQSIVRVGGKWIGKGVMQYIGAPRAKTREANEKSEFMQNRMRTRFRELNELRNRVEGQTSARERVNASAYVLMMRFQQVVDVPTWHGAYEKAIAQGRDEAGAIALADQAVIDAQGGGQMKDLAAIERGGAGAKLFTVFYSFMNTALNIGVAQGMTNKSAAKTAADMALLYVVPAVLGILLKDALTPGDADDEDDSLLKKLAAEQIGFLFGLVVVGREFGEAAKTMSGTSDRPRDYAGPAGLRVLTDIYSLGKQINQGEFDDSFRKSAINVTGGLFGLPAAQINRTINGAQALNEGKTENPAALLLGFQEP